MSGKAYRWALDQNAGSALAKSVLLRLADAADVRWWCWSDVPTLAAVTEATESAVRHALRLLEDRGLLVIMVGISEDGAPVPSCYMLNAPDGPQGTSHGP